jgi:single-stranded-DNA-specific exonuclease
MIWKLKEQAPEKFISSFPEYPLAVLNLLHHRGLKTQAQVDEFFNPDYEGDLHDPFLMLGMKEAVKRIKKAIAKQEQIAIFGDYDADGVCGSVILKTILEKLGANTAGGVFIPNRLKEGYGLNAEAIKKTVAGGTKLIITVDCGISSVEEIALANKLGAQVLVTDHHQVGKTLPAAKIIINPWQVKDKYPFRDLAGAGVTFKLAQALVLESETVSAGWEKWLLDLVALATVADCMPLLGENRTLVRYGLIVLAQTKRPGLQELMKVARLSPVFEIEKLSTNLDAYSLGFVLAPRLNAAGRIEHADLALDLLLTEDREKAKEMAQKINEHNRRRQKMTEEIVTEIESRIKQAVSEKQDPFIIESSKDWSPGIIGLVAGKIADRHHRPTMIFNEQEGGTLRGSARSVVGFNVVEAIAECQDLMIEFGGHPGAAGLGLKKENFSKFKEKINKIASAKLLDKDLTPVLEIDAQLQAEDINWPLFDELIKFEPFGKDNEAPIFLAKDFIISALRVVGNGSKHLKLELKSQKLPGKIFKAIGFGLVKNNQAEFKVGDNVDLVFEIIKDEWNGRRDLQLRVEDIKKKE